MCGVTRWANIRNEWMCGVTRRDNIRNEHIRATTGVAQSSIKIKGKRPKWYGHVIRTKEEHVVGSILHVDTSGKMRGRPT